MADTSLVDAARAWVIEAYPYNRDHLICALDWLDRLAPDAREAVRLAALTHDMERAFPAPDAPVMTRLNDPEYYQRHAERSARLVGAWLAAAGASTPLVRDVERLVLAHETGGWHEADLVQAADSLSFLDTNVDLFLDFVRNGRFSVADVRWKFEHSYQRIQVPAARALALPRYEAADARLTLLEESRPGTPA